MLSTRLALPLWRPTQEASLQALLRSDSELPGWGILNWISGRVTTFQITHTGLSPDVCCRPRLPPGQVRLSSSSWAVHHRISGRHLPQVLHRPPLAFLMAQGSTTQGTYIQRKHVRYKALNVNHTVNLATRDTWTLPNSVFGPPELLSGLFPTVAHCAVSSPRASSCWLWSAVSAKKASLMVWSDCCVTSHESGEWCGV